MTDFKRPISAVAQEILRDWQKPHPFAKPYLDAMLTLRLPTDRYLAEDGHSIVVYFLANASTYRGDRARLLKAELRAIIGE